MPARGALRGTFRSLEGFNYRAWAIGTFVSNVGTWMQRTAIAWLVLTQLTHGNASGVGIVLTLQFVPQVLLLPWTGFAADRLDRRRLLCATQAVMGALALGLGLLTVAGLVQLWHVYALAFLIGSASAFETPARVIFVSDMVVDADLPNAVALNYASFNAARMVGPAIAGLLIASVGSGWVILINGVSYVAVLCSLSVLRVGELHPKRRDPVRRGGLADGVRYLWNRSDLKALGLMHFSIGAFGLAFTLFISTMAVTAFHRGAGQYGLLLSTFAMGAIVGALIAARQVQPGVGTSVLSAFALGGGLALLAITPTYGTFCIALVLTGMAASTFTIGANSAMQLTTDRRIRGRVMAFVIAVSFGATAAGAPILGWVVDKFGPRWGLAVGASACFLAAMIGVAHLAKARAAERG
jgi:MFS family permease